MSVGDPAGHGESEAGAGQWPRAASTACAAMSAGRLFAADRCQV
ncbi:hypothetical protein [Streptomyces sp. NPDC020571]